MTFVKKPVKGMTDILPADMALRNFALEAIKSVYASYGFSQIETPMMESIENLTSKQGGDNEKLIFKVLKRGASFDKAWDAKDRDGLVDTGLRYDLTVPLARFYACHKEELPSPFRALQVGPVWRADQPARGRFRQFYQCDIDVLGDETNLAEIELIAATSQALVTVLSQANISQFTVSVNDRRILLAAASAAGFAEEAMNSVLVILDKLDKIGFDGVRGELLEVEPNAAVVDRYLEMFQSANLEGLRAQDFVAPLKNPDLAAVAQNLDSIIETARGLCAPGVTIQFNPTLVRGMGYYTGPIFEVTVADFGISIAGGGRYDEMIGKFSGEAVCACGFSIGFERIITLLADAKATGTPSADKEALAILVDGKAADEVRKSALELAQKRRGEGLHCAVFPMRKNMKHQIATLEAAGFTQFEKIYGD